MKNPHELAEERLLLSEEYSRYAGELAEYIKKEAHFFGEHRQEYKSDNTCQKAFARTDDGARMTILKLKLKSIVQKMSGIKTMIEVLTEEARGLY